MAKAVKVDLERNKERAKKRLTAKEEAKIRSNRERRSARWSNALKKLPDHAAAKTELDWVRGHPAMTRLERMDDRTPETKLMLGVSDLNGCQGAYKAAPSKGSVHMLQHWCNRPEEFWKMVLGEHKKRLSGSASLEDDPHETPQEIKDIDEFLKAIAGGV